jgi:hypothetical protein
VRERLITLLCALGALTLFVTMFFHGDERGGVGRDVPRPTTEERGGNGYRGAMEWLDSGHFRVVSLRERFDKLEKRTGFAQTGNILIVTLPAVGIFKTEEFRPLDRWVRAGNTLLVLAALSDTPDWAYFQKTTASSDLNLLTGLEFETVRAREQRLHNSPAAESSKHSVADEVAAAARRFGEPERERLVPNRPHAYFSGVQEATALSDFAVMPWTAKVPYEGFVLALAHERQSSEGVFWTRPLGNGRIVVSALGSLFTNRAIGLADNARLLSNIIATDLGSQGTVLFDDVHQGLGASYDPGKFYADPRLHITLAIMALLWLTWVLGGTRLRVPVTRAPVPREAELVRATGGFLARVLAPAAAARRMFEHFLRHSSWEKLERQSRIAAADLRQLQAWHLKANSGRRVPLTRLHNLMVRINRQLHS